MAQALEEPGWEDMDNVGEEDEKAGEVEYDEDVFCCVAEVECLLLCQLVL